MWIIPNDRATISQLKQGFQLLFHHPLLCSSAATSQTRTLGQAQGPGGTRCPSPPALRRRLAGTFHKIRLVPSLLSTGAVRQPLQKCHTLGATSGLSHFNTSEFNEIHPDFQQRVNKITVLSGWTLNQPPAPKSPSCSVYQVCSFPCFSGTFSLLFLLKIQSPGFAREERGSAAAPRSGRAADAVPGRGFRCHGHRWDEHTSTGWFTTA